MRTLLQPKPAPVLLMSLGLVLLATPDAAIAADCGGDYVECLDRTGAAGSSDQLHEMECYGDYWSCVSRQIKLF